MHTLSNNPFTQWEIGIALAVIAIIVTIAIPVFLRKRKKLSYEIVSTTSIIRKEDKGKLQILFDGEEIDDAYSIVVTIKNTGNVPIKSDDYESPITLEVRDGRLLTAEIKTANPTSLTSIKINVGEARVVFEPTLLNSRDSISLSMLATSGKVTPPTARIAGVREIKLISTDTPKIILALVGALFIVAAETLKLSNVPQTALVVQITTTVGAATFCVFFAQLFRKLSKRLDMWPF